jgi:uncharacterized phage-associated protein
MVMSVADVAAEIRARMPGIGMTKLHKLLYYCQGYHLAMQGRLLFEETISAWDMGPVVGAFWHDEKQGQASPGERSKLDNSQLNTIGYVLSRYGSLGTDRLIEMAHAEPPYQAADAHRSKGGRVRMEPARMRQYFADVLKSERPDVDQSALRALLAGAVDRRKAPVRGDSGEGIRRLAARAGGDGDRKASRMPWSAGSHLTVPIRICGSRSSTGV